MNVIRRFHLFEARIAKRRIVHIGTDRSLLGSRADRPGNESRLVRRECRKLVGCLSSVRHASKIDFANKLFRKLEITQTNQARLESIGFDDVRASFQILAVQARDFLGVRQTKNVCTVLQIVMPILETFATDLFFGKAQTENHGTHSSIKHQDFLFKSLEEQSGTIGFCCDRHGDSDSI